MKPIYWIILVGIVLIMAIYVGWDYLGAGAPSEEAMATRAISGSTQEERLKAARDLCLDKRPNALPETRRVATESQDPEVLVLVLNHLKKNNDVKGLPVFLNAMKHEDAKVREAGYDGALRIYGGSWPDRTLDYQVNGPPEQREQAVNKLLDMHNNPQPPPPPPQ